MNNTRASKQNIQLGHYDPLDVDIVYSIFGVSDPPELPLRQELLTQGVELVHGAKGVGQKAVCKEQRKRERRLLRKIKRLERKLEKKRSNKGTSQKRERAIAMVRQLRISMEHCARTISYEVYLEELRKVSKVPHDSRPNVECNNLSHDSVELPSDCTNHDGSINTHVVENKLLQALEMWNENEYEMHSSDGESLVYTDDDSIHSVLSVDDTSATDEITDISSYTHLHQDFNNPSVQKKIRFTPPDTDETEIKSKVKLVGINAQQDVDHVESDGSQEETVSPVWSKVNIDSAAPLSSNSNENLSISLLASCRRVSLMRRLSDDSLPTIVKSSSSSSVRFKDVKPTLEDNLARARALVQNAKVMQKCISHESSPSEPYSMSRKQSDSVNTHSNGSGRYHLLVCRACPWSHRTLVVRTIKGLEKIIGVSYLECSWKPRAHSDISSMINPDSDVSFWSIEDDSGDENDEVFQAFKEIYLKQNKDKFIRVPILWDDRTKTVVGKSSTEIMWMLNFDFNKWAKQPKINLFPHGKKLEHDEINRWLHRSLFAGVYRCGLATNQRQYDEAIQDLTDALDSVEEIVSKNGFLVGDEMTASDVRLFVVLIRLDEIYRVLFKTNTRRVSSMTGLMEYVKDIYNVKGMKDTCDFTSMKRQYFGANSQGGKYIIPRGGMFIKLLEDVDVIQS
jgi:Predicted glutathione S-transferase